MFVCPVCVHRADSKGCCLWNSLYFQGIFTRQGLAGQGSQLSLGAVQVSSPSCGSRLLRLMDGLGSRLSTGLCWYVFGLPLVLILRTSSTCQGIFQGITGSSSCQI